jgi:hypothetical protein
MDVSLWVRLTATVGQVSDLIGTVGWTNFRGPYPCASVKRARMIGIGQECILDSRALN